MSICEKCEYYDLTDDEEWCNNSGELLGDITCGNTTKSECDDFQEREDDNPGVIFCQMIKCERCGKSILELLGTEHPVCQTCSRGPPNSCCEMH